jgi:hydrogenase assembly chaperone HypC/HupF
MCVTVPYCVVEVTDGGAAVVSRDGVRSTVSLLATDVVPEPGEWVLVHSGFVLARLPEADVQQLVRDLRSGGSP